MNKFFARAKRLFLSSANLVELSQHCIFGILMWIGMFTGAKQMASNNSICGSSTTAVYLCATFAILLQILCWFPITAAFLAASQSWVLVRSRVLPKGGSIVLAVIRLIWMLEFIIFIIMLGMEIYMAILNKTEAATEASKFLRFINSNTGVMAGEALLPDQLKSTLPILISLVSTTGSITRNTSLCHQVKSSNDNSTESIFVNTFRFNCGNATNQISCEGLFISNYNRYYGERVSFLITVTCLSIGLCYVLIWPRSYEYKLYHQSQNFIDWNLAAHNMLAQQAALISAPVGVPTYRQFSPGHRPYSLAVTTCNHTTVPNSYNKSTNDQVTLIENENSIMSDSNTVSLANAQLSSGTQVNPPTSSVASGPMNGNRVVVREGSLPGSTRSYSHDDLPTKVRAKNRFKFSFPSFKNTSLGKV